MVVAPVGCSSSGATAPETTLSQQGNPKDGKVGMTLTLPGGEQINTVNWTITGPNGATTVVQTGSVDVANSTTISFLVAGIPAASNYSISLTGTSVDGSVTCSGSASFNTTALTTTNVSVALQCNTAAPEAGSALVTAGTYNCGTVTAISASPSEVNVGYPLTVTASATAPNSGGLTYAWSAPSGSFDNASSASPHFTCSTPGNVTLQVTVGDGTVPVGSTCNTALNTSTITVKCDSGPLQNDIQNIVVIYAENRSFDGLFGNYPGANGLANAAAHYVPQKDRDGVTILSNLPPTWGGATAAGNLTATVPQTATIGLPNLPFEIETAFDTLNDSGSYGMSTADVTRDMYHRFFENIMDINGGTNDGFAAWEDAGGLVLGHFDYSHDQLYALAQQYVVADNFFQGAYGGSFLNHQYLICGCAPAIPSTFPTTNPGASVNVLGTTITNPVTHQSVVQLATTVTPPPSALSAAPSLKTGNLSPAGYFQSMYPSDGSTGYRGVNTMQPAYQPSGNLPTTNNLYANPAGSTTVPPQTQTNIGDLLNGQGVNWAWYAQDWNAAVADGTQAPSATRTVIYANPLGAALETPDFQTHHQAFNYFSEFDPGTTAGAANRAAHLKDLTDLQAAIPAAPAACTLPPVAFYKPAGYQNMHPGYANIDAADAHIAGLVNSIKASACWAHTVIVITFDEFGGQWDHVAPPVGDLLGPGTRIPAIVISPYAKAAGTVDHTQYDTGSISRLISHRFGLPLLPGIAYRDAALVANGGTPMGDLTNALTLP
jgi:acid phosphatase